MNEKLNTLKKKQLFMLDNNRENLYSQGITDRQAIHRMEAHLSRKSAQKDETFILKKDLKNQGWQSESTIWESGIRRFTH